MFGTFESAEKDYLSPPEHDYHCSDCGERFDPEECMDYELILCDDCWLEKQKNGEEPESEKKG